MQISFAKVLKSVRTQPTTATILAKNLSRINAIITKNVVVGTVPVFYFCIGGTASATNWDYKLTEDGQTLIIENTIEAITCFPTPAATEINVSEGQDKVS